MTPESLGRLLADLKAGREIKPGPQNGRQASAPMGGPNTLLDPELYRHELPDDAPPNYQPEPTPPKPRSRKAKSTVKDR